jgi:SSS family solute:Na+ symporter/sodium/proline symporter
MMLASFTLALALFVVVGISSAAYSRGTKADYYLCSQSVPPAFVGLSAVATNNSGFMFIGLIGFTFAVGIASLWLMLGWVVGDFLMSLVVHERLRRFTERRGEVTFAGVLARWWGTEHAVLRRIIAILTLVFLGTYAAAQLNAGGKALQALFGWDPRSGALIVAAIVAAYCLAGGMRASIWTDVAQSVVMFVAMGAMLAIGLATVGGVGSAVAGLSRVPGYLDPFPPDLLLPGAAGMLLFVVGWMFAGMSVIGQPHIMVRFMALNDPNSLARARVYYYGFFTLFYGMAACVGLLSRLLLPELETLDPELALPMMAVELLPPVFVGVVIAGIFAATMSTADSLVLSCSSALTHDLLPQRIERPLELKAVTLLVVLLALAIAVYGTQSVFSLVIFAWSALASAFGPLLFIYARGHQVTQALAVAMILVGLCTALAWRGLGWQDMVYEGMPGMLAGVLVFELSRPWLERLLPERRL